MEMKREQTVVELIVQHAVSFQRIILDSKYVMITANVGWCFQKYSFFYLQPIAWIIYKMDSKREQTAVDLIVQHAVSFQQIILDSKYLTNTVNVELVFSETFIFLPLATCMDNLQNGYETGIDCGGTDCTACRKFLANYS